MKFKRGDWVKMTPLGEEQLIQADEPPKRGIVINCEPPYVSVVRDGRKSVERYHIDFWQLEGKKHDWGEK